MMGGYCIKTWAKTLPILALSTAEAELMAVVKGSTEVLGLQALLKDLGIEMKAAVKSDATAAIGIVGRLGLGKVRHLSVADLWIQQAARSGRIAYSKIPGQINPADLFTKAVEREVMERHSQFMGQETIAGQAETAPKRRDIEKKDQQADGQKRSVELKA